MDKKQEKNKQSRLRRELDKIIQRTYTQGLCLACGINPATCVHHFIPKAQSNNLRDDPKNLVPICRGCHFAHHTKGDPEIHRKIERIRGKAWADDLQARRYTIKKFTIGYLEEEIEKYGN